MARITGVGGVFFKSKGDPAALAEWYRKHLGMPMSDFGGAILRWPRIEASPCGISQRQTASGSAQAILRS